jgi:hypothetical protein
MVLRIEGERAALPTAGVAVQIEGARCVLVVAIEGLSGAIEGAGVARIVVGKGVGVGSEKRPRYRLYK